MTELKSWYLEQYPLFNCDDCGGEHFKFPRLGGKDPLIPVELINMGQPVGLNGNDLPFAVLAWGVPTTNVVTNMSVIFLQ